MLDAESYFKKGNIRLKYFGGSVFLRFSEKKKEIKSWHVPGSPNWNANLIIGELKIFTRIPR